MSKKAYKIVNLIIAVLIFVFGVGNAFAWLADERKIKGPWFNGSSGDTYFAGGDGKSEQTAYQIANYYHLYNLAWLQNTGKLSKQYYFKLNNDVDIPSNFWLPPIGTDTQPFIGKFDGKGHKISGLKITTDSSKLGNISKSVTFSNAVGMFGMTGVDSGAEIHNFILKEPIVEVAAQNAKYSSSTSDNKDMVAGLAIGYLNTNCKAYSIGVLADENTKTTGAQLLMQRGENCEYSTFNSIIGALGDQVTSSVTGGGHIGVGGSGSSFGASFDVDGMYKRLLKINDNNGASWHFPGLDKGNDNLTLAKLYKLPFTVVPDTSTETPKSSYVGSDAQEIVANNNIGYLIGNQNKVYQWTRTFGEPLVDDDKDGTWTFANGDTPAGAKTIPRWLYRETAQNVAGDNYSSGSGFSPLTQSEFNALPENIKTFVLGLNSEEAFEAIRIQQQYQNVGAQIYPGSEANEQWSPHGQISWNGNTYGDGFRKGSYKDPVVNKDGIPMNADGVLLDDTYYDGTTNTKCYQFDIVDGVRYYRPNSEEWTLPIYSIDENGHAKNENGIFYDSNGYLIDDEGYAYNEQGYIASTNEWPIQNYSIDSDGYIVKDGSYYIDAEGNKIYAYGYDKDSSGQLVYKDGDKAGQVVGIPMGGWSATLKARKGVYVDAKVGSPCEFYRYQKGIALPNSSIWFKPSQVGKIRLILYAETGGDGFALLKGQRTNATKDNPFVVDYSLSGSDIKATEIMKYNLPSYVLFYFEYDVTVEDIEAGNIEFWLGKYGSNGAYFVYMDLGASAAEDEDTSKIDREKSVSAIDFIYEGVSIAQMDDIAANPAYKLGDFIVGSTLYEATGTSVFFDKLDLVLEIVYIRKSVEVDPTMDVTVTGTTDRTKVGDTKAKTDFTFIAA